MNSTHFAVASFLRMMKSPDGELIFLTSNEVEARDFEGNPVNALSPSADQFSIMGAIRLAAYKQAIPESELIVAIIDKLLVA